MIDHDRLFKELLTTFFIQFLELFAPELATELLIGLPLDRARQQLTSGFVDTYLRLERTEELQFTNQADTILGQIEKERIMELTTSWKEAGRVEGHAQGKAEGKAEGKVEGRVEGETLVVLRLLHRRCGALPQSLQERVRQLSLEQLETLAEALLDFASTTDLEQWLNKAAPAVMVTPKSISS